MAEELARKKYESGEEKKGRLVQSFSLPLVDDVAIFVYHFTRWLFLSRALHKYPGLLNLFACSASRNNPSLSTLRSIVSLVVDLSARKQRTMDQDQSELRSLGFLGVYGETSKIVLKWRKTFAQIALALILPLCATYLAHSLVSQLLAYKIIDHEITRYDTWRDGDLSRRLKKEWVAFWLVWLGYFILAFAFSLLSTSAIASAVACVYAEAEQATFKKVMRVVPRVWKRLTATFIWGFAIFFVYSAVAVGLLIVWLVIVRRSSVGVVLGIAVAVVVLILYVVGIIYITMIWQLASVISVLEDAYGRKAIAKSRKLMKGKMGVSVGCFLGVLVCAVLVQALFQCLVVFDLVPGIGIKIGVGLICLLLLMVVVLFDLVVQTVIYFVCKSHHHENIDSSSPCVGQKPDQLEQLHV